MSRIRHPRRLRRRMRERVMMPKEMMMIRSVEIHVKLRGVLINVSKN